MEWIWEAMGIILIAVILFVIMWFVWPAGTRPLQDKPKRAKVTFIPRDGKPVDVTHLSDDLYQGGGVGGWSGVAPKKLAKYRGDSHIDLEGVTVKPVDPEYAEYLKNFPNTDDPRR